MISPHLSLSKCPQSPLRPTTSQRNASIKAQFCFCQTPTALSANVRLLLLVMSEPSAASKRDLIRDTWGHRHRLQAAGAGLAFVLGTPRSLSQLHSILEEQRIHGDLLLDGLLTDTYRNLTRKVLSGLVWTTEQSRSQLRYVAKIDMDNFVNVKRLRAIGEEADKTAGKVWVTGRYHTSSRPVRDEHSKFYISERDFPASVYPRYFNGPAYMLSIDAVCRIVNSNALEELRNGKALFLEDVYITGVLRKRLHITPVQNAAVFPLYFTYNAQDDDAFRSSLATKVAVHMEQDRKMFNKMLKMIEVR